MTKQDLVIIVFGKIITTPIKGLDILKKPCSFGKASLSDPEFYSLFYIKINHYMRCFWVRLTGEDITLFHFFLLKAPIYIHVHFTFK